LSLRRKGIESCIDSTDCTSARHTGYCPYHWSFFSGASDVIIYANMPYAGTWSSGFSILRQRKPVPNNNPDADLEISPTSHEQFECVTDPVGGGWYDSNGEEIGTSVRITWSSGTRRQ